MSNERLLEEILEQLTRIADSTEYLTCFMQDKQEVEILANAAMKCLAEVGDGDA